MTLLRRAVPLHVIAICGIFATTAVAEVISAFFIEGSTATMQDAVDRIWDKAEQRFQAADPRWLGNAQRALADEAAQVSDVLESAGQDYAAAWKAHLRWNLLLRNIEPTQAPRYDELAIVRRWMYSNREGLEYPLFAKLRLRLDEYLDAVYTLAHADLAETFAERIAEVRSRAHNVIEQPSDPNAALLGGTLGWFAQTRQLTNEVSATRRLLARPNLQIVIANSFLQRAAADQLAEVSQTVRLNDTVTAPAGRFGRRTRTLRVNGSAGTTGSVAVQPIPNARVAQVNLVFRGEVHSRYRADAGPVMLHLATLGPVRATKPLYLGATGLTAGATAVDARVSSRVRSVSAGSQLLRRIGRRQAGRPSARAHMQSTGRQRTIRQLTQEMDQRVVAAIDGMAGRWDNAQDLLGGVEQVVAPLVREGAVPAVGPSRSTTSTIQFGVDSTRRNQFGASTPCPLKREHGDVSMALHVSFFNNTTETMLGGKILSDKFLMKYAEVLHAQLPLPLMVHTRAQRWGVKAAKYRPLTMSIPGEREFAFRLSIEGIVIDGRSVDIPATAVARYRLETDEFGDYRLRRMGPLSLESNLPPSEKAFLSEKLSAFFGPTITAAGVAIPETDRFDALRETKIRTLSTIGQWLVIGLDIPTAAIQELMQI